jgi:hypothetical protein
MPDEMVRAPPRGRRWSMGDAASVLGNAAKAAQALQTLGPSTGETSSANDDDAVTQLILEDESGNVPWSDAQRLKVLKSDTGAAIETTRHALVRLINGKDDREPKAIELRVRDVFDTLTRVTANIVSEHSEASAITTRKRLEAQASGFDIKLQAARKATVVAVGNMKLECEAMHQKQLEEQVQILCSGMLHRAQTLL